jgi:large subunit ribosomal protein L18
MSSLKKTRKRRQTRARRIRKRLVQENVLPRISVFRSAKHIYGQVIDDGLQKTVVSFSSLDLKDTTGDKKAVAHTVGKELAKRAKDKGIQAVVFDRGPYRYHGRIKALADGLREGSLTL